MYCRCHAGHQVLHVSFDRYAAAGVVFFGLVVCERLLPGTPSSWTRQGCVAPCCTLSQVSYSKMSQAHQSHSQMFYHMPYVT